MRVPNRWTAAGAAAALVALLATGAEAAAVAPLATTYRLASAGPTGTAGNGASSVASMSADGRYVAFASTATDLVPGDTNAAADVFRRDLTSGVTERISVGGAGEQSAGTASLPALSGDGTHVAFWSTASDLLPGGQPGLFAKDLVSGAVTQVAVADPALGQRPALSADGRRIVWADGDVHLFDALSASTQDLGPGTTPAIAADGSTVAYTRKQAGVVGGVTLSGRRRVVVAYDVAAATSTVVSVNTKGREPRGESFGPSVDGAGSLVAFFSRANDLVAGDTNRTGDLFVRSRGSATTARYALGFTKEPPAPTAIAADGTAVAAPTGSSTIVVTRASGAATTVGPTQVGQPVALDGHGGLLAFTAPSALAPTDLNGVSDVYVATLPPPGESHVRVAISDAPDPVTAGATLTYTVTVTADGPSTATGVAIALPVPSGVSDPVAPGCTVTPTTVTCAIGTLAAGSSASRTIKVTAGAAGTVAAVVQVSSTSVDPDPTGHSATATTQVVAPPATTLSISGGRVLEGAPSAALTFTITASAVSDGSIQVAYATADGTANAGVDYTAKSGTASLPVGATSVTIAVPVLDDRIAEADETVSMTLSAPVGATIATATASATINDDDEPISVGAGDLTLNEGTGGTVTASVPVRLSAPAPRALALSYATANGTAAAPGDYAARSGTITIAAGQSQGSIPVPIVPDATDEANETFTVSITAVPSWASIADGSATVTIVDDDGPITPGPGPFVRISDWFTVEQSSNHSVPITITLSRLSPSTVTIPWSTVAGSASAGSDFLPASGSVVFAPGQTSKTISVMVVADHVAESREQFGIHLGAASGVTIEDDTGTVTIADDD